MDFFSISVFSGIPCRFYSWAQYFSSPPSLSLSCTLFCILFKSCWACAVRACHINAHYRKTHFTWMWMNCMISSNFVSQKWSRSWSSNLLPAFIRVPVNSIFNVIRLLRLNSGIKLQSNEEIRRIYITLYLDKKKQNKSKKVKKEDKGRNFYLSQPDSHVEPVLIKTIHSLVHNFFSRYCQHNIPTNKMHSNWYFCRFLFSTQFL